ncbi:MAG: DNA polymerase III subunit gamma/tau [Firmicutes bacterium]|nr:DNA polymerase III subunit gamma/tau [Bacillota bacterium]
MSSSYTALYRKYRPKSFADVIGQEPIAATLTNQVSLGRISHAYLFTGSRGTGKTSCAKIFARAVNCQKPKKGSPCDKCAACKALAEPANMDILEIDAASNNKVDEVREIRERVKYLPVSGKYKVYIIDEVHMLTDSAFNALLKTLEEPPAHVVFILATTEPHKLPATILSRCMRFDFRLVPLGVLTAHLQKVFDLEKKAYEQQAAEYIAAAAEGSVRDMLSIADTCIHFSDGTLTRADVLRVLGASGLEQVADFFAALQAGDDGGALTHIDEFIKSGKSAGLLAKDTAAYARDLLAIKTGAQQLISRAKEDIQSMAAAAECAEKDFLVYVITEFSRIDSELRYSVSPRIVLEAAALRAARFSAGGVSPVPVAAPAPVRTQAKPPPETTVLPVHTIADAVKAVKEEDAKSIWGRLVTRFRKSGDMNLYTLLGEHSDYVIEGGSLIITAQDDKYLRFSDPSAVAEIERALSESGIPYRVRIEKAAQGVDMDKEIVRVQKLTGIKPNIEK